MTVHQQQRRDRLARAQGYLARIEAGETAAEIARQEGICRERVGQIVGEIRPRRRLNAGWTDQLVAEPRRQWAAGVPTEAIGSAIGVSKNAVIGKAHRLGLRHSSHMTGDVSGGKVAERTGLGKTKLYDLMHKGEFPAARRVGGSVAWLSGDVIEWMAALPTSDNKAGVGADDAQESAA